MKRTANNHLSLDFLKTNISSVAFLALILVGSWRMAAQQTTNRLHSAESIIAIQHDITEAVLRWQFHHVAERFITYSPYFVSVGSSSTNGDPPKETTYTFDRYYRARKKPTGWDIQNVAFFSH